MDNLTDLVDGAMRKDQNAITRIYIVTKDKALYIARDMLKDEDEAQDVVQEAFIKAFDNLDSLERPEKFQGWLDTIVINRCRDLLRKKRPVLFTQLASDDDNDATLQWEDTNEEFQPEANLDYSETRRLIKEMIDSLPDPQRIATTLFYLEDMPVKDISAFMGCSENTVKSRLNLARKNIKEKVLALEKKGTRLYCVPFIPFLYWMYKQEIVAYAAVSAGTAAAAGTVGAGAAGTTSVGTAGTSVGTAAATATAAVKGVGVGMAAKTVIAAAVVLTVVGGSAAILNHLNNKTETLAVVRNSEEPGMTPEGAGMAAFELSEEELSALQALYELKDATDTDEFMECIMQNRLVLYNLYQDKLKGGAYLFTGEKLEPTNTGTGVYLKDPNTVYSGDLVGGLPDGQGNLGRWWWGWDTMVPPDNHFSKGKAFGVLVGESYLGGWSEGKAEGTGVNSQREFREYSGFDMEVYRKTEETDSQEGGYADTTTTSTYKDGLENGLAEINFYGNTYRINVQNGKVVMDEHVMQETINGRVHYYMLAQDGENRHLFVPDTIRKNNCLWDFKTSNDIFLEYMPAVPLIQDWAFIEGHEDIEYYIPFNDYPRFTVDVLDYAISQGYVPDEDLVEENYSNGMIMCDGDPLVTDDYIQFHFIVDSDYLDDWVEFDFRYYIADGSDDFTRSGAAGQADQADEDLMNTIGTEVFRRFTALLWDSITSDDYEAKCNNQLQFVGKNASDDQKMSIVRILTCYTNKLWNTGAQELEDSSSYKVTKEVYDNTLASAIGTTENGSAWKMGVADWGAEYSDSASPDGSYLIVYSGDYGLAWPDCTVEQTEYMGHGLYKVSGKVGYVADPDFVEMAGGISTVPEIPYEAVYKSNRNSLFMGLTLVSFKTFQ